MKYNTIVAVLLATLAITSNAAVPLRWTVETSRVQPAVFDAVRGETLDLEATLQSSGKPVAIDPQADWKIYWQTNGMADAWWSAPAEVRTGRALTPGNSSSTNILSATFTPAMDPGANAVVGFLGSPGNNYRAAFTLRFRHGPGATPNAIAQPVPVLDLANTVVINAPWPTDETIKAVVREVVDETGVSGGVDTKAVREIAAEVVAPVAAEVDDKVSKSGDRMTGPLIIGNGSLIIGNVGINDDESLAVENEIRALGGFSRFADSWSGQPKLKWMGEYFEDSMSGIYGRIYIPYADAPWIDAIREGSVRGFALYSDLEGLLTSEVEPLKDDVQSAYAWSQNVYRYMTANTNAWFAGTNYVTNAEQAAQRHKFAFEAGMDLATVPCSMALCEIRDGEKVCVWDQRDWNSWYWAFKRQQLMGEINPQIESKADKAWSHHTATGIDNPAEDTVWLDTPKVVLSAGYAWQRNQTTRGSFFTLVNRGGLTSVGSNRDGSYFEIKDDEGNSIFKISKTDSYMADADAASVHVDDSVTLTVDYPSTVQPVAYCCADLAEADFKAESDPDCPATVSWSHAGSTYTVRATPKVPDGKLFLFAKIMVEGQTKNEFAAPVEFQKIVIGGVTYTVGTATINGNTVLTLTR